MLVRKVSIQNVRSFLDRQEFLLDGRISIVIGPNGGGKTNLLDTVVTMLRRHLLTRMHLTPAPTAEQEDRYEFRDNDILNSMQLERHSKGDPNFPQVIEIELEATGPDIKNMKAMKDDADMLIKRAGKKYVNLNIQNAKNWDLAGVKAEDRFSYRVENQGLAGRTPDAETFLQYLQLFEMDGRLREEFEIAPLSRPMIYLPVNRSANGFQSRVQLASYNEYEFRRQSTAVYSRSNTPIVQLAIGKLAQKFRLLLEKDKGGAEKAFRADKNLEELTKVLQELGYEWTLASVNPLKNEYDVRLEKQGSSFLVSAASSGERELLTYLFAIFALNVRDALIIVDEPELHLHPKWQKTLLQMFVRLSETTGNQFLLATHAPTFVSPQSIQYVSRVISKDQKSRIVRLNSTVLPETKHLFNIVNSQNNERIFFADKVILVEGISDRIFFEALLEAYGQSDAGKSIIEVVSVGGKGFFKSYKKILEACQIEHSIIADLDYIEQVGTNEVKALFALDEKDIKDNVIDDISSLDGAALVARIDEAMKTGKWDDANKTWDYIKSRRRKLRTNLSAEEQLLLDAFLLSKRDEKIYILSEGDLEAYLPDGYKSKDLEKLIQLISCDKLLTELPKETLPELEEIVKLLLQEETPPASAVPVAEDTAITVPTA